MGMNCVKIGKKNVSSVATSSNMSLYVNFSLQHALVITVLIISIVNTVSRQNPDFYFMFYMNAECFPPVHYYNGCL